MGYITYFYGGIHLKDKKAVKILNYLLKEKIYPFEWLEGTEIDENEKYMSINENWKNYQNQMENILFFIKHLDKKAEGIINCKGEEDEDLWKIMLDENGVGVFRAKILYEEREGFFEEETESKAKELLNDKQLDKKMILSSLKK